MKKQMLTKDQELWLKTGYEAASQGIRPSAGYIMKEVGDKLQSDFDPEFYSIYI